MLGVKELGVFAKKKKKKLMTIDMRHPGIDAACLIFFEVGMFERGLGKGAVVKYWMLVTEGVVCWFSRYVS